MSKVLFLVTTYDPNVKFFKKCMEHVERARDFLYKRNDRVTVDIMIVDFGKGTKIDKYLEKASFPFLYFQRPDKSMTENVNLGIGRAVEKGYDFFVYSNDDITIHEEWFANAIDFMQNNKDAGFVGTTYPAMGWLMDIEDMEIPEPINKKEKIENFVRLYWEFSCCMMRVETLEKVGFMDERIGGKPGFASDNDYLLRIKKAGWENYRSYMLTAWHAKGITQRHYRHPGMKEDPIKEQANEYLWRKWGLDITDQNAITREEDTFKIPFNGASDV